MSLLKNLETKAGVEGEKDILGGGGALDSGLYDLTVKVAYVTTSSGGALALNTIFDYNGKEVRQQFWMTSGNDKGNKNTYTKDNKEHYLPGFLTANSLALLTVGKEISQLDLEEKTINCQESWKIVFLIIFTYIGILITFVVTRGHPELLTYLFTVIVKYGIQS